MGSELSLTDERAKKATVVSQGIDPQRRMRRGDVLLLAIRQPVTVELPKSYANASGIEVDTTFGIVQLRSGVLLGLKPDDQRSPLVVREKDDGRTEDARLQLTTAPSVSVDPKRKDADDRFSAALQDVLRGIASSDIDTSSAINTPLAIALQSAAKWEDDQKEID